MKDSEKEKQKQEEVKTKYIAHVLIKINDKYLVIKRTAIKRGKPNVYPEYWDIPGGMVEENENIEDAAIRETKEEVNLDIEVKEIIHEDRNFDKEKNTIFKRIVFKGILLKNQGLNNIILQKDEHSEFKLIDNLSELDKYVEYLKKVIK